VRKTVAWLSSFRWTERHHNFLTKHTAEWGEQNLLANFLPVELATDTFGSHTEPYIRKAAHGYNFTPLDLTASRLARGLACLRRSRGCPGPG